MQNAPREHSAILSTFIKLPFVFKTFVLSIFEWPLKTGFTVVANSVDPDQTAPYLIWFYTFVDNFVDYFVSECVVNHLLCR